MSKVLGILNLHDGPSLGELTKQHALGSTSFMGRFGLMDFALSNFTNSSIPSIDILVDRHIHSITSHIRSGNVWVTNTKTGYLHQLVNEENLSSKKLNTDIANILANFKNLKEDIKEDYVVVASSFFLMSYDYRPLIKEHRSSGADITLVYTHTKNADNEYLNCDSLVLDGNKVVDVKVNTGHKKEQDIFLETYIMNRKTFINICEKAYGISRLYNLRDMIKYDIKNNLCKIYASRFDGLVVPILSYKDFVNHSFEMLDVNNFFNLVKPDWPVYTTTQNTPPCLYTATSEVKNSTLSNGCIIKGRVENSILSRNVIIEEGAVVKNCILFSGCRVRKGVKLNYVLAGKRVNFEEKKNISGSKDDVFYIDYDLKV